MFLLPCLSLKCFFEQAHGNYIFRGTSSMSFIQILKTNFWACFFFSFNVFFLVEHMVFHIDKYTRNSRGKSNGKNEQRVSNAQEWDGSRSWIFKSRSVLCCAVLVYGEMVAIIYGDYIVWQFIGIRKNVSMYPES